MRRHISYANVTVSLELFVALSSGSYAAVELSASSVGSNQIRNGQVKRPDIARNAIDASRVQPGRSRSRTPARSRSSRSSRWSTTSAS